MSDNLPHEGDTSAPIPAELDDPKSFTEYLASACAAKIFDDVRPMGPREAAFVLGYSQVYPSFKQLVRLLLHDPWNLKVGQSQVITIALHRLAATLVDPADHNDPAYADLVVKTLLAETYKFFNWDSRCESKFMNVGRAIAEFIATWNNKIDDDDGIRLRMDAYLELHSKIFYWLPGELGGLVRPFGQYHPSLANAAEEGGGTNDTYREHLSNGFLQLSTALSQPPMTTPLGVCDALARQVYAFERFPNDIHLSSDTLGDKSQILAQNKSGTVVLFRVGNVPAALVKRKAVETMTGAQHKIIKALLDADGRRLSENELKTNSGCGDARKILKELADTEPWTNVISLPQAKGTGYGIEE